MSEGRKLIFVSRIRLFFRTLMGDTFNLLGLPGFVRECSYSGGVAHAEITVKHGALFTIISVNGLDIYFHRLTGTIDGIGGVPANDDEAAGIAQGLKEMAEGKTQSIESIRAEIAEREARRG